MNYVNTRFLLQPDRIISNSGKVVIFHQEGKIIDRLNLQNLSRRIRNILSVALGFIGATGFIASSPFLLFFAFFCFLSLLYLSKEIKQVFALSALFGLSYYGLGLYWLFGLSARYGLDFLPILLLINAVIVLLIASLIVFSASLVSYFREKFWILSGSNAWAIFWIPAAFTLGEWFKFYYFSGLPWMQISHLWVDYLDYSFAGELGVSFLIYQIISILVVLVFGRNSWPNNLFLIIVPVLCYLVITEGLISNQEGFQNSKNLSIKVIHTEISKRGKSSISASETRIRLLQQLSAREPSADIVIWPEGLSSVGVKHFNGLEEGFSKLEDAGSIVLWGGYYNDQEDNGYNAIFENSSKTPVYIKQKLVPFGEYMPPYLDAIKPYFPLIRQGTLSTDREFDKNYNFQGRQVSMLICFEILFSNRIREKSREAEFILLFSDLNFFNANWFKEYFLDIARIRASEMGIPLIQATNKGISAIISSKGEVINRAQDITKAIHGSIPSVQDKTLYAKYGNILVLLLAGINLLIACVFRTTLSPITGTSADNLKN